MGLGCRSYPRSRRVPLPRAQSPGPAAALPPPGAVLQSAACAATAASMRSSPPRAARAAAWDGLVMGASLSHPCTHRARQSSAVGRGVFHPHPLRQVISIPATRAASCCSPHPHASLDPPAVRHSPDEALVHHGIGQRPHGSPGAKQPLHFLLPQLFACRLPVGLPRLHGPLPQHLRWGVERGARWATPLPPQEGCGAPAG